MKSFLAALTRHPISLAGTAVTTVSAALFLTLFTLDMIGLPGHPYFGILAYVIVPAIFVVGLLLIPVGIHFARKRAAQPGREFPVIDFNLPVYRNRLLIVLALTVVNAVIVAVATYKSVEVMDTTAFCGKACHSVMEPEHTAFLRGAHASARCVDCHIGPGAGWFVKSKLSGSWQLVSVAFNLYPTPIPSPVHNLRPARETCEQCHWPAKFVGDRLKVITKHKDDEANTPIKTVLLLRVGGVSGRESKGIHWHVDPENTIRYRSDESREKIAEVELTQAGGKVERWFAPGADEGAAAKEGVWRTMDCVDCHNRPSHTFRSPEYEVDGAIESGRIAADLPYVRREGLKLVQATYTDRGTAQSSIRAGLEAFYEQNYPEIAKTRRTEVSAAAEALFEGWAANVFPQMKVQWGTYPNHIGHQQSPGCWRCHDDEHKTKEGRRISQDCDTCHSLLAEEEPDPAILKTLAP